MMTLIENLFYTFRTSSYEPATAVYILLAGFFGLSLLAILFRFISKIKAFALFGG